MHRKLLTILVLALLSCIASSNSSAQSLRPELEKVSSAVEAYVQKLKPDWHHKISEQPSPDVAVHFWNSEKCAVADLTIDGAHTGKHPVPCLIKLAIDQSASASAARERLVSFARDEPSATVILVGEKGYIWREGVVFIKGKFTFWLGGGLHFCPYFRRDAYLLSRRRV